MADLLPHLESFIDTTEEIVQLLKEKLTEIERHHKKCNVVKTVGTSVTTVGSILTIGSLLLAPITGGASIVAATGFGAALALGGAATNITTDVVDFFASKSFQSDVQNICNRRNQAGSLLQQHLTQIREIANELHLLGRDEEESFYLALSGYNKKAVLSNAKNIAQKINDSYKMGRNLSMARNLRSFGLRNGGKVWQSMRGMSNKLTWVFGQLGFNIGKKTAMSVVRNGTIVLTSVFVIWDIYSLIDSWKTKHPTTQAVLEYIQSIENGLEPLIELKTFLEQQSLQEAD